MTSGLENKVSDSVFDILLQNQCNIEFSFISKFSNFELALFVIWQSYFSLPEAGWLFSKKKEPVEPGNNSEKKKKDPCSQWNQNEMTFQ